MARPISVRRCRASDLDHVLEIERASFASDAWPRELFLDLLAGSPRLFLVAAFEGRIAGYIAAVVRRGAGELVSIAVHPQCRRRGVAGALLRRVLAILRREGVAECWLMVRPGNRAAIRFYRSFGFVRLRRVGDYYGRGRDGLRMRASTGESAESSTARSAASSR